MTVPEFLNLGYKRWIEVHWRIAGTVEQVEAIMLRQGISGKVFRMCYPQTTPKNSDGFFAHWIGIKKENNRK